MNKRCISFHLISSYSSVHTYDFSFISHNIPKWSYEHLRQIGLFPCWCWLKLASKMYYESWVLTCSKVFGISSQFISLHVLQILIPYSCQSSFLELLSWLVEEGVHLAWCFFIRISCRSMISMKVASLLGLQVGFDMMVSHCLLMVWLKLVCVLKIVGLTLVSWILMVSCISGKLFCLVCLLWYMLKIHIIMTSWL